MVFLAYVPDYLYVVDAVAELDGPAREFPDPPAESADGVVIVVVVVVRQVVVRSKFVAHRLQKRRVLK